MIPVHTNEPLDTKLTFRRSFIPVSFLSLHYKECYTYAASTVMPTERIQTSFTGIFVRYVNQTFLEFTRTV